jgi:predicted nucleic acid-binding protein
MNGEIRLEFVDTNIFVYAYDLSAGKKHETALDLVRQLWDSRQGCISIQVLQELFESLTRKINPPLDTDLAAQIIRDLSTWQTVVPGIEDVLQAIGITLRYKISFWDAMIIQSAIHVGCKQIWSEDLSDRQIYDQVRIFNPFVITEHKTPSG